MALLTIAIPSFNRNDTLARNLALLLPQLTGECCLTIVDNASDVPLAETLTFLQDFGGCPVQVIRNRVNIGANANILRCLESCATKWIWILGDDDPVKPDAIATMLRQIEASPDCIYINFRSGLAPERAGLRTGSGISEFVEALDSFSNALFISTSVFNGSELLKYISFGYQYAYASAPHLAVLFAGMGDTGQWCFSNDEIVTVVTTKTADQKWFPLTPALGKMTLLELPMGNKARRSLARKLSAKPRLEYLVLCLVRLARGTGSGEESMFLYRQLCARLYWSDKSIAMYFRRFLGGVLIRNWALTNWAVDTMTRKLKAPRWDHYKAMIDQAGVDRWQRLL